MQRDGINRRHSGALPDENQTRRFEISASSTEGVLQQSGQLGDDVSFAAHSNRLVTLGAGFEIDERRDAADAELSGNARSVIDIDFGDGEFADILRGDFIHHRAKHAAGSAPGSPEINQHGGAGGFDERSEIRVVEFGYIGISHRKSVVGFLKKKGSTEHCPELDAKRSQCHDRRGDAENEIGITGFAFGDIGCGGF